MPIFDPDLLLEGMAFAGTAMTKFMFHIYTGTLVAEMFWT